MEGDKSRQERWLVTRSRILEATLQTLVADGYASTTMQRVQARAGVSRGSLTHHFSSMEELLVAAVHRLAERQVAQLSEALAGSQPQDLAGLVDDLHKTMSGPEFAAGLELWMAARTNQALRDALVPRERELGAHLRMVLLDETRLDGASLDRSDLDALLALLRGMAITGTLREDRAAQRAVLDRWIAQAQRAPRRSADAPLQG